VTARELTPPERAAWAAAVRRGLDVTPADVRAIVWAADVERLALDAERYAARQDPAPGRMPRVDPADPGRNSVPLADHARLVYDVPAGARLCPACQGRGCASCQASGIVAAAGGAR